MRVYLAGNMHTDWRERVASQVTGCELLWPQKVPSRNGSEKGNADVFFPRDVVLLRSADLVFCCIETEGRNIGTAAEVGMAYAWGKPVILVNLCPDVHGFKFLEKASTTVCYSLEEGLETLKFLAIPSPGAGALPNLSR